MNESIRPGGEMVEAARHALSEAVLVALTQLYGAAVPVAMMGPWAEWADAQPVGAEVTVELHALAETDDPVIGQVGRALVALRAALEALEAGDALPPSALKLVKRPD